MKKKVLLMLLCLVALTANAASDPVLLEKGKCGDNVTWSVYSNPDDGSAYMVIEGNGAMYDDPYEKPWRKYADKVTFITVRMGVTHIGSYAFRNYPKLGGISLWSTVESIGNYAFDNCTSLKRARTDNVKTFGISAFGGCTSLTSVGINKATEIGYRAFAGTAIASVDLSKVTELEEWAFSDCKQLASVTLPKGGTTIPQSLFSGCPKLKTVTIPSSITKIGREAFNGSGIESITIPASVTDICRRAFMGCKSLKSVTFEGATLPLLEKDAFGGHADGCKFYAQPDFKIKEGSDVDAAREGFVSSGSCNSDISYTFENGTLTLTGAGAIPDYDDLGKRPWDGFKSVILKIVIGDGITSIGKNAFAFSDVRTVTLANSVTTIGKYAFNESLYLKDIVLPANLQTIGSYAFRACNLSGNFDIPATVTTIENNAFERCYNINKIVFKGTTLPDIGWSTFDYEPNRSFVVPAGYTFIDESKWKDEYKANFLVEGKCGENAEFVYIASEKLLRITGTGAIGDYTLNSQPWTNFKDKITEIEIKDGITSIGSHAFGEFSNLDEITIPSSVKTVGDHAFYNCSSLKWFGDNDYVETVGDYAYAGCSALASIGLLAVKSIGEGAYRNCSMLSAVTFGSKVLPTVGSLAFDGNDSERKFFTEVGYSFKDEKTWTDDYKSAIVVKGKNYTYSYNPTTKTLTISGKGPMEDYESQSMPWHAHKAAEHVIVEGDLESIGNCAFYEFTDMKDITLPGTVKSIGLAAFGYCRSLSSVTLPEQLREIGENAFLTCQSLTEVTIPASVTTIGKSAFESCEALLKVNLEPTTLPTLTGSTAFDKGHSQRKFYVNAGYSFNDESTWTDEYKNAFMVKTGTGIVYNYNSSTKTLTFSGTGEMEDYGLDNIPWQNYKSDIEKVVIGEGITKVGSYSFWMCGNLASVTIPSTVTSIGAAAFSYCKKLPSIKLPEGLKSIDFGAFYSCDVLTEITIPSTVTEISRQAFGTCPALVKVTFESTTLPTLTGKNAFDDNAANRRFYVKSGYTFSDESTWTDEYKSVIMVKTSTDVAYNYDEEYHVLTIGGKGAMADYDSDTLPWNAYSNQVEEIIVEDGVTSIGKDAFYGFENLEYVTFEGSVTSIGENAFANCRKLLDITLPETLQTIGMRAFEHCEALSEITLPSSLTKIGYNAFWYCYGVTDVYCNAEPGDLTWETSNEGDESFMLDKATICHVLVGTLKDWIDGFSDVNVSFLADQRDGVTGTGTEDDPYLLMNADDMRWMATKFNAADAAERATVEGKYFKLIDDIDFDYMEENNYTPVKSFKGVFDGDGHVIYGVSVNMTDNNDAALFGKVEDGSTIKNIIIDYSEFTGAAGAAIASQIYGSTSIENCHITKDVTITSNRTRTSAGGVVAYMQPDGAPTVKNCSSQATVTSADSNAGGIVGMILAGTIDNCMYLANSNNINVNEARYKKGAIVGGYNGGTVTNSYYTVSSLTDEKGTLMPDADVDNTEFLTKLHERDEYMMEAGMPEELIGYDITLNNRMLSAVPNKSKAYAVCLPFDMNITDIYGETDDILVYDLLQVDLDNNRFVFTNEFPILKAGSSYIVVVKKGDILLMGRNVIVNPTPTPKVVNKDGTETQVGWWKGTFQKMNNTEVLNEKAYILQKNGTFRRSNTKNTSFVLDAFTGYFAATDNLSAKAFKMKFQRTENGEAEGEVTDFPADEFEGGIDFPDEEDTGISSVSSDAITTDGNWYTLDGRKLSSKPTQKGVYIHQGKKKVVK